MITSASNQQIKNIVKLQKSGKARREQGVYLVEGIRMFREIPSSEFVKFYMSEGFYEKQFGGKELIGKGTLDKENSWIEGKDYEIVSDSVFREMSDTQTPQGILAVVKQKQYRREDLLTSAEVDMPCILVLENLQDPGNLGTILRTAEGAGVTGVMMSKDTVDIYNPKVVRATMGAIFRVPFLYEEDIMAGVDWLHQKNVRCYAAHLNGNSFYDLDYRGATCFLIGNEGNGLTDELATQADEKIKIPMMGNVESLNAATAATVLIYETMRQRM